MRDLLFLLYVLFLPVQIPIAAQFRIAPSDVILVVLFLSSLGSVSRIPFNRRAWSVLHVALLFVFAASTLTLALRTGHVTMYAILNKDMGILILLMGYYVITLYASTWDSIRNALRLLVVSVTLHTAIALIAFIITRATGREFEALNYSDTRLSGMLQDPNAFGGLIAVGLIVLLVCSDKTDPLVGPCRDMACLSLMTLGLVLTYSRSAWAGFSFAFIMSIVVKPSSLKRMGVLAGTAFIGVILLYGRNYKESILALTDRAAGITTRADLIDNALSLFRQYPVAGVGMGGFYDHFGDHIVHNTFLWLLVDTGVIGAAVFSMLMMWMVYRGSLGYQRNSGNKRLICLALVLSHVAMLSFSLGIEALSQRHWWFVMALIGSAYALSPRRHQFILAAPLVPRRLPSHALRK